MKSTIITLIVFLLAGGILPAQQTNGIPGVISYQGMITASDGSPIADGEYSITVTLYGDEKGTIRVWQDRYMTPVHGGVFSIYLGSGTVALPAPGGMDRGLWIGARIDGEEEMRPLTRLGSSPYAMNVPDGAIGTNKLANGAVTAEKMGVDYISGVSVNGKKIEIDGRVLNIQAGKDIDIDYNEATHSLIIGSPADSRGDGKDRDHTIQGTALDAWTLNGEGVNVNTGASVTAVQGDWIGTNGAGGNLVDFDIHVSGSSVMRYQQKIAGTTPNIVGGNVGNTVGAFAVGNVIAGGGGVGVVNTIVGNNYNTISGGISHKIDHQGSQYGVIAGGQNNLISNGASAVTHGAIGGGQANNIIASYGTVGGGFTNRILHASSPYGTIGGGQNNDIGGATGAPYGTIGGGQGNRILGNYGTVGGGAANSIQNPSSGYSTIAGGQGNEIGFGGNVATYGTIGGGLVNHVTGSHGTVAGGLGNSVSDYSTIAGGSDNTITTYYGAIAGGAFNNISQPFGAIGGGENNSVDKAHSVVGGGENNIVEASNAAIGGGLGNLILNNGFGAAIPGGDLLTAQSYGQTVIGVLNIPKGNVSVGNVPNDEPIFIIGNGIDRITASNAFEVSYNGHSTVFDNTQGTTPVILGSTYVDNVVYAWGNIDRSGQPRCTPFGVASVVQRTTGWYEITIDVRNPDGDRVQIECGSVTATIASQNGPGSGWFTCANISVTQIVNNVFDVYITDRDCNPVDEGFMFKVTGRP